MLWWLFVLQGSMEVELQATYTALGFQEGNDYHREPDCVGKTSVTSQCSNPR